MEVSNELLIDCIHAIEKGHGKELINMELSLVENHWGLLEALLLEVKASRLAKLQGEIDVLKKKGAWSNPVQKPPASSMEVLKGG